MRKTSCILLLGVVLAGGCGSSDTGFVGPLESGGSGVQARATIPAAGGEVAIPEGTGFSGSLFFEPGADPAAEIAMTSSLAPPDANLPLVGLNSPQAQTEHYFFLRFSVSRPIPLGLLESIRLRGDLPSGHEHYHADLYRLGNGSNLAQAAASTFLQEIPGEHTGTEAVFDEVLDSTMLQPGEEYALRFKSTDQQTLDLTVVNDSGVGPCYIFIRGGNPNLSANDPRPYWVNSEGELVPMSVNDLVDGYADYSIPLPADGKIKLPLASSGRIYISLGEKIKTVLHGGTSDSDPTTWAAPDGWSNAADPNFRTLWDWVEFDYKLSPDSGLPGMGINTTQVQMMGIPTTLTLTGPTSGTQISGAKGAGTRSAIFGALQADPVFKTLVVEGTATNTNVSPIRAASADNGIRNVTNNHPGVPTFSADFYDDYIDQVWEKYKTEDLTMVTSAFGTFLGRVNEQGQMLFTQAGERTVVVPKPGGDDVIIGDGALLAASPNAKTPREQAILGEIASAMSACFNRSTLLVFPKMLRNPDPTFKTYDPSIFYQNAPTNLYSKLMHQHSLPTPQAPYGGAYGFGFDDNLNQSSFIADNKAPTSLTITIPEF